MPQRFLFAVGEVEHQVGGGLRVEGQLVLRVDVFGHRLAGQADGDEPVDAGVEPLAVERTPVGIRRDEVFDLHLLEFTGAEDEVARGDFVAKGLADLGDAEGDFNAAGIDDVLVVGKDALGGLGAQVGGGRVVGKGPTLVSNISLNSRGSVRVLSSVASGPSVRARSSPLTSVNSI